MVATESYQLWLALVRTQRRLPVLKKELDLREEIKGAHGRKRKRGLPSGTVALLHPRNYPTVVVHVLSLSKWYQWPVTGVIWRLLHVNIAGRRSNIEGVGVAFAHVRSIGAVPEQLHSLLPSVQRAAVHCAALSWTSLGALHRRVRHKAHVFWRSPPQHP